MLKNKRKVTFQIQQVDYHNFFVTNYFKLHSFYSVLTDPDNKNLTNLNCATFLFSNMNGLLYKILKMKCNTIISIINH